MKKILVLFLFSQLFYTSFSQNNIDVTHYRFSIALNDSNDIIHGVATIEGTWKSASTQLSLDLVQSKNDTGMTVADVKGNGVTGFQQNDNKLLINFSTAGQMNDSFKISITYSGLPADGLIISRNKFGQRCFFSDNWPDRAHYWIPCKDEPGDKSTVEFLVTAPDHYQVISNGLKIEETNLPSHLKLTHWKEDVPLPTKIMVIGAADFAVSFTGEVNCVPVYSWVFPENKDAGFKDYAEAKDILSFYMNYIGPYPYKKLANVQSKTIYGGMENANAIFYYENSVDGKQRQEGLLAHEIAHQWFGDMATEKAFAHIWLSEGFATYLTLIFTESRYGTDSLNHELQRDRRQVYAFAQQSTRPVVDSVSAYKDLLTPNSYQKGGWILHMLRRQLGDSTFHSIIRTYYDTYKGKNANTEDFKAIVEKISGKKLDMFFRQWLYTPGVPHLKISWSYDEKKKKLELKLLPGQKTIGYPLELSIEVPSGQNILKTIAVSDQPQAISIPVTGRPVRIIADPKTSSLAEVVIEALK